VKERISSVGVEPYGGSPEHLGKSLREEIENGQMS
jgi:hypothetical protein